MEKEWGFLNTGFHNAAVNMALDEALLNWHSKGEIPPTLRLYGWKVPSLTVGHFQKAEKSIDFNALEKHGCQYVRRLTGGSAVLHDNELTYSLVISEQDPSLPKSVKEAYYVLSKGVLEGYKNLGIQADYAIPEKKRNKDRTAICFEKPASYEMVVDGKKISGNAQTRKKGVLLQHGSIPMSIDAEMLFDMFLFPSEAIKQRKRESFEKKAITIDQLTNQKHTYDMMTVAFKEGFRTGLDIELNPIELSKSQWEEVYHLANTKYDSSLWNNKSKERVISGRTSNVYT
ncbi:lipoate-protein ligase A [Virgibacillus natechei]|uniref:Lipoate-protein ligase A n=1 Tax=Virgibacillus natechei TaxID=1216297 RepID=A0ABS4IC20_9BACI|nr:lipoate-protein ligase A [Virgibacillus natechei]UZD13597.1 lipoate--protein ligase family protein [Virgibacillus natechei]